MPPFQDYKISLRKKSSQQGLMLGWNTCYFFLVEIPRLLLLRACSWKFLEFFVGKGLAGPCQVSTWCLCLRWSYAPVQTSSFYRGCCLGWAGQVLSLKKARFSIPVMSGTWLASTSSWGPSAPLHLSLPLLAQALTSLVWGTQWPPAGPCLHFPTYNLCFTEASVVVYCCYNKWTQN